MTSLYIYFRVDFLVHNASGVEKAAAGERREEEQERQRMCNISVRLAVDVLLHESVDVH